MALMMPTLDIPEMISLKDALIKIKEEDTPANREKLLRELRSVKEIDLYSRVSIFTLLEHKYADNSFAFSQGDTKELLTYAMDNPEKYGFNFSILSLMKDFNPSDMTKIIDLYHFNN
jgi:hypothetical protein